MEVIVGKLAGFCGGVNYSVTGAQKIVFEKKQPSGRLCPGGCIFIKSFSQIVFLRCERSLRRAPLWIKGGPKGRGD